MRKPVAVMALACALLAGLAACDQSTGSAQPSSTSTVPTTPPVDVSDFESGPESPMTYGLQVPRGAIQLGPLVRYRSPRLISAYEPELRAALDQKAAEDREKAAQAESDGTPLPSTLPTPEPRPSEDTFNLLDEPPKPDSTISLMRVDGNPTKVVRRMLAQISLALPNSTIVTDDLSEYCEAKNRRITSCRLALRGLTSDDRDIRITMTVDPGNVTTRTSPPSAKTRPIMTVTIEYVGEPRKGQFTRESSDLGEVPAIDSKADRSGLIWPKMDEDAAPTTKLLNGWVAPTAATIILSGFRPKLVAITTARAAEADLIAEQFAASNGAKGKYTKDVVEDLNEVSTTYTATTASGSIARATYILSARGNYTALYYSPAPQ